MLSSLPNELIVVIIAALPIIELRGAIPVGVELGLPIFQAWYLSILGNLLPILPILYFFQPLSNYLMRYRIYQKFYDWLYNRTMRKSDKVQQWGALGLVLFTAVPLPTTGAWTACFAAILFRIPVRLSFSAISLGVVLAGFIVAFLSNMLLG
ncbi:ligand-binding protein SH3 [Desulfuribacillus stibiiarsenatis]|uniref:Ligand-binding protein SH3 n=2 Tax=Desulfuribacillus stibiiarsenatis TaxID=1390249 RepID=A0A1E5L3Z5_9FIRM|nr:ligand-binding protein SH3 [Desulfuribacillus stibiiarsenatis]